MFAVRRTGLHFVSMVDSVNIVAGPTLTAAHHRNRLFFEQNQRRHSSTQLPFGVQHFFQYGSDAYATQTIEAGIQAFQSVLHVSPVGSFILMGVTIRLALLPMHIYAEKLLAKRIHVVNLLKAKMLQKISDQYGLKVVPNADKTQLTLDTDNKEVIMKTLQVIGNNVNKYAAKNGIQRSRIFFMKYIPIPVWIYSTFAIRNILYADFKPVYEGFGWLRDLASPDPYCIIPICVGILGLINVHSQRIIYPQQQRSQQIYDGIMIFVTLFAVKIMSTLPVCIPLYWLTVSSTGLVQNLLLRHPKVKGLFGIARLPGDSKTPFRDLITFARRERPFPPPLS